MKSLMIQGTSSGSGKTTLVTALCRIFADKGFSVAPFKSQNMSNYAYKTKDFEISRAQAIQAIAARCEITPDLNPILLKPLGNYYSNVYLNGKMFKKMHASEYYQKFVKTKGLTLATKSFKHLQKNHDLIILEGAGSPSEINLEKFDIANMKMAEISNSSVLLITDIDRGGSFASIVGTMSLLDKKYQELIKGFVINKFRGDINILKPGFKKIKEITKRSVLGTIPMIDLNLPEEDSLSGNAKNIVWNKKNLVKIENEIDKLSKLVKSNLNIAEIERMIGC
ncbi:MAG: cobyric acid synthase [Nitrosopumilales archaeon CG11_big_fil_rev_8_21_14_0_20_33_24]|nr:MAG: cobyric acid synthase [Nitrosopumilales archaeon CG11_big_fil_rev_8_21_14_0_20_33_24]PIY90548.1 MAG: cobyric acid synthase [Nitrosopumilales archaeon CG_4_10_14_0_8_um_filter_34_8]PJB99100.1 MAG: cobyric acid synthase [Nitrosopumilales archaeon CG_4_9_14_0_8_um_filter_34_10]